MSTYTSEPNGVYVDGSLASTMLRLKLAILRNGLSGSRTKKVFATIGIGGSLIGAIGSAVRLATQAGVADGQRAFESVLLGLSMLFGLWVFGPLLVGGVDDSLDPTRLALLPLQRRELRQGLLIGAFIGPLPLATLVTLTGVLIGWGDLDASLAMTAGIVVEALLLFVSMSRALSVVLAFSGRSRRGKDLSVLIASLGAASLFLGTQSLRFLSNADKTRVVRSLQWLPSGQLARALDDVRGGLPLLAAGRMVAIAMVIALCFHVWLSGVERLLVDPDASRHARSAGSTDVQALIPRPLRWMRRSSVLVLASKELRYLLRSPQRRSSLIVSVVIGTVFALLQSMRYATSNPNAVFGAFVAALFGVHATNNVLGADASSLWLEQTAGVRLRDQLRARSIAAAPNLLIPTVLAALVLAVLSGGWSEFALVSLCSVALVGIPMGVGVAVSVIAPFNQPDSGNPYSNKRVTTGQGGLVSLFAVVGIVSLLVLAAPAGVLVLLAWYTENILIVSVAIALCAAWSWGVWRLGLRLALRRVPDGGVNLLTVLGGRSANV